MGACFFKDVRHCQVTDPAGDAAGNDFLHGGDLFAALLIAADQSRI